MPRISGRPCRKGVSLRNGGCIALLLAASLPFCGVAWAQATVRFDETLASDRPEAWAMKYVAASTLMTAFGETPALPPWRWGVALDLGHVPRLSEAQQRVGFNASKQEDLNKSPVFGRLRLVAGLPGGFVAELGYTPPLKIRGARPRDLFAVAIGRRVLEGEGYSVSMRAFGQHGRGQGDITCPARLAGVEDLERNPFACRAASDDHIELGHYGIDVTSSWSVRSWQAHLGVGAARAELAVQVDALTANVRDRSRLDHRGTLPYVAIGASRNLDERWKLAVEVLHVPLRVRRGADAARESDPLTSLRLQLRHRFE